MGKEPQKYYKGSFNIRISPKIHRKADLIARSRRISLNKFVEEAINDSIKTNK
ncbi:MAG: toxin-antitoxin system HicB family antitoxin [Atribacterota bacterium]|nr:toxin-antitoxin system HicB family antitoxin [Atribacterota bacterium]